MKRALVILLVACGGGDPGVASPSEDTIFPLSWSAGERFAAVAVQLQRVDPATLGDGTCSVLTQLVTATESGEVARIDEEGPCIVTSGDLDLRGAPGLAPLCAGTLDVAVGSFRQTLTLCDIVPDPAPIECSMLEGATTVDITSFPDERDGDALGEGTASLMRDRVPRVMSPAPAGDGAAVWPDGGLVVGWGGFGAASIELVLRERGGSGPVVRCFVDDTGRFEIPERLVAPYRTQITSLEVARVSQTRVEIDGVDVRLSDRQSDAIQIFPRSGS